MVDLERRCSSRVELQIPIRFRSRDLPPKYPELATRSINVSSGGLLFKSPCPLVVGSELLVKMRVPTEISGSAFTAFEHRARVVHEYKLDGGELAYGIRLEDPQVMRSMRSNDWT